MLSPILEKRQSRKRVTIPIPNIEAGTAKEAVSANLPCASSKKPNLQRAGAAVSGTLSPPSSPSEDGDKKKKKKGQQQKKKDVDIDRLLVSPRKREFCPSIVMGTRLQSRIKSAGQHNIDFGTDDENGSESSDEEENDYVPSNPGSLADALGMWIDASKFAAPIREYGQEPPPIQTHNGTTLVSFTASKDASIRSNLSSDEDSQNYTQERIKFITNKGSSTDNRVSSAREHNHQQHQLVDSSMRSNMSSDVERAYCDITLPMKGGDGVEEHQMLYGLPKCSVRGKVNDFSSKLDMSERSTETGFDSLESPLNFQEYTQNVKDAYFYCKGGIKGSGLDSSHRSIVSNSDDSLSTPDKVYPLALNGNKCAKKTPASYYCSPSPFDVSGRSDAYSVESTFVENYSDGAYEMSSYKDTSTRSNDTNLSDEPAVGCLYGLPDCSIRAKVGEESILDFSTRSHGDESVESAYNAESSSERYTPIHRPARTA